jgi:hypothetical protein
MREQTAKTIRQIVYHDLARKDHFYRKDEKGTIFCTGKRAEYKRTKRAFNENKKKG